MLLDLKIGPLQDYYKKAIKEYKEFIEDPDDQEITKQNKCCGDKMSPVKKDTVHTLLSKRLSAIRGAIDYHLQLLIFESKNADNDIDPEYLMFLNDDLKLQVLLSNDDILESRRERTKETILRMKGVTQSYNMFDTHLYKKASKMMEKI